ncbi:serine hydrolase domain-containing protein [Streptomyces sp. NPDC020742]|uniref:serine hydrolase domain-containing protein n=1 Tax=Streptomyces TaxID=1883 RepID=UPI0033EEE5B9
MPSGYSTDAARPMRLDTIFDVAGLTKVLAVRASIGTLVEDGKLQLDEPLCAFWPEVNGHPLGQATAHHLLTHAAGLPLRANLKNLYGGDAQGIRDGVLHEALHRPPGEAGGSGHHVPGPGSPATPGRRRASVLGLVGYGVSGLLLAMEARRCLDILGAKANKQRFLDYLSSQSVYLVVWVDLSSTRFLLATFEPRRGHEHG